MKLFTIVFGSIFLLFISSCTPAALGTATANPIKVAFAEDVLETESVDIVAGEIIYVQVEQPSGYFAFNERKLNQLDSRLEIPIGASEDDDFVTEVSSWFTLVGHQLFYSANGEFVEVNNEDWGVELKKAVAQRRIDSVNRGRSNTNTVNIRYIDWINFVFAITSDTRAGGEYFVVATIQAQGGKTEEVVLRLKVPSNGLPKDLPTGSISGFAS